MATIVDHGQFPCTCFNVTTVSGSTETSRRASVSRLFRCPQIMGRARDHTSCVKLLFQGFVHVVPDDWIAARPMDS